MTYHNTRMTTCDIFWRVHDGLYLRAIARNQCHVVDCVWMVRIGIESEDECGDDTDKKNDAPTIRAILFLLDPILIRLIIPDSLQWHWRFTEYSRMV